jgi:hypothetical protein
LKERIKFKSSKTEIREEKRAERTIADATERHICAVDKPAKHNVLLCM